MTVLAVANAKGGVGKTTTVATLAHVYSSQGVRVTAIDCDPQGDLTTSFGYVPHDLDPARTVAGPLYRHLQTPPSGPRLAEVAIPLEGRPDLTLVPSNRETAKIIKLIESDPFGVSAASRMIAEYRDEAPADLILLDVPPTLGTYILSLLAAADHVLVPVTPDVRAFGGLETIMGSLTQLRTVGQNPNVALAGVFLTHYDTTTRLSKEADAHMAAYRGRGVAQLTSIPRSIRVSDAALDGKPITEHSPNHKAAQAYRQLAGELADIIDLPIPVGASR